MPTDSRTWIRSMAGRHEMKVEKSPSPVERRRKARPAPEFPGCRTITIRRDEIATWGGRFELWDADTETAWVMREPDRLRPRGSVAASRRARPVDRRGARRSHRVRRHDGPAHAQQSGRVVADPPGGPGGLPSPGAVADAGRGGDGDRGARPSGRGAGGGPYDGRSPGEARALRGLGVPRGLGGGSRALVAEPAGRAAAPGSRFICWRAGRTGRLWRAARSRNGRRRRSTPR